MRCVCCNRNLSDYESTLRHARTNEFLDTCRKCLADIPIPVKGRKDLNPNETFDDEQTVFVKLDDVDE